MVPGTITAVSAGTLQGIFRPQARIYYRNAKYGTLYETLTKPIRCKTRARAITLAREWIKTDDFTHLANEARARIAANPENTLEATP